MTVSVVVPIYNVEKYVDKCIQSLVNQTYKNIEIVLIHDGGKDNSLSICRQWALKDNRIILIDQPNQGVSVSRNVGINHTHGEWICFVDGDDYLEENAIEAMVSSMDKDSDVLITDFFVDGKENIIPQSFLSIGECIFTGKDLIELIKNCFLKTSIADSKCITALGVPWAKLYRSELIRKNNIEYPPNMRKMQDALFNAEIFHFCQKVQFKKIRTYHYNQNDSSITHRGNPNYDKIGEAVLESFDQFIKKYEYENQLRSVYDARKFMFAFENIKYKYILDRNGIKYSEKINGVKQIMKQLYIKDGKNIFPYLGKAYTIAYYLYKLHLYNMMYIMMCIYYRYRTSLVK